MRIRALLVLLLSAALATAYEDIDNPGTASSVLPGSVAWTAVTNALADDTTYASCPSALTQACYTMNLTGWGFNIPSSATITGITVTVDLYSGTSTATNHCNESTVKLMKAGVGAGSNLATNNYWPNAAANVTYGGGDNLWGTTWTAAEINNARFGFILQPYVTRGSGTRTCYVDFATIAVNYTAPVLFDTPSINLTGTIYEEMTVNHTVLATSRLDTMVFAWNASNAWTNMTEVQIDSFPAQISNISALTGLAGRTIGYKFYGNNSEDVWNVSSTGSYNVETTTTTTTTTSSTTTTEPPTTTTTTTTSSTTTTESTTTTTTSTTSTTVPGSFEYYCSDTWLTGVTWYY